MFILGKTFEPIKLEPYYFYFFLLLNLLPVLYFKYFPTCDGPAHLYNSRIIIELLINSDSPLEHFFNFNNTLSSNWLGHLILSFSLLFLPSFIAEKILLLIYLIGLPISFRYLASSIGVSCKYLTYLIFPFTYSYLFYFGFFNFNIALVLLLLGLGFWISSNKHFTSSKILIFMVISTLLSVSHLLVFGFYLVILLILALKDIIPFYNWDKSGRNNYIKRWGLLLITLLPGVINLVYFIYLKPSMISSSYLSLHDLIISLKYIMPAKGINYAGYSLICRIILYIFVTLMLYVSINTLYYLILSKKIVLNNILWIPVIFLTLLFLFTLPDSNSTIGFVSSRIMLLFFIFLILWLSSQKVPLLIKIVIFVLINITNYSILFHNFKSVSPGCIIANEVNTAAKFIKPYSTVLPLNNSNNILYTHISNYLGSGNPIVVLENYEAKTEIFPLKWSKVNQNCLLSTDYSIKINLAFHLAPECLAQLNYIFILSDNNKRGINFSDSIDKILNKSFTLSYCGKSGEVKLYKNRNL